MLRADAITNAVTDATNATDATDATGATDATDDVTVTAIANDIQ